MMSIPLKQSTASQEIFLGVMVDATDGFTPETGLTVANTDIMLGKAGATSLVAKNSGGGTHTAGGVYSAVLDATDSNTLGPLMIFSQPTGARPVVLMCCVYEANVYDSLIAATDKLLVDAVELNSSATAAARAALLYQFGINTDTVAASPAPTTTQFAGALTGASYPDNCFRNGAVVFQTGSNASLTPHPISSFTSSSSLYTFAVALPFAPVAGTVFLIVGVSG
jgi:hypothetical protein